jgi:hypothetical protein
MENLPHFVEYSNTNFVLEGKPTYGVGCYDSTFYFDHFVVQNNPYFELDS